MLFKKNKNKDKKNTSDKESEDIKNCSMCSVSLEVIDELLNEEK